MPTTPAVVSSVVIYRDTSYRLLTVKVTLNKATTETQRFLYNVSGTGLIYYLKVPLPTNEVKYITDDKQGLFVVPSGVSEFYFGLTNTFSAFDDIVTTAIGRINGDLIGKKTVPVIQFTVDAPNPGSVNILSFNVGGINSSIVTTGNIESIPAGIINTLPTPTASPSAATQSATGPNPYNYSTHLNRVITALENIATAQAALAYRAREQLAISEEILEKLSSIESLSKDTGIKTAGAYDWLSYSSLLNLYDEEGKDLKSLKEDFDRKIQGKE